MANLTQQSNNTIARKTENQLNSPRLKTNEVTKFKKQDNELENKDLNLKHEVNRLKKKIADQDETIDDLDQERDELYDEIYRLRLTLAEAWKITLATDAEKAREVANCTREQSTRKETAAPKEKKP